MSNDNALYSVIGDTSEKIYDACDVLIETIGKFRKPDSASIASFLHPGPKGDKYPWIVMIGPGPVMCDHATESAREFIDQMNKQVLNGQVQEEEEEEGDGDD